MKLYRYLIIMAVSLLILNGCRSSKPVTPRFFLLEYPAETEITDTIATLPFSLEINDVDLHPAYSSTQIAIREGEMEVQYFVNNQWASRPYQSLERIITTYYKKNPFFESISTRFWNVQPDFTLTTTVYNLEVIRERKTFQARLNIEFRIESSEGEIIAVHTSDNIRQLERRDLNQFARAINNMFFEELHYFSKKAHFEISQR